MSTALEAGKWPAHPVADLFPRMTDEELADLAADIKANGLIHPIVVDQKGLLIDGRNRAKACEIAGIEPTVRMFEGDDPRAFILSMNLKRRHMSAGQQAMAHAMIYPEPEKGGRGKKSKNSTETLGFSAMRLSQARTVLSHSRDVAIEILAGTKFLDKEYATAKKRTVQRGAVRAKKVPVLPDKCAVDALAKARAVTVTAPASAHAANETDAPSDSVEALAEFKAACDLWLPQLNERDRDKASTHVNSMFEKLRNSRGSPEQAA